MKNNDYFDLLSIGKINKKEYDLLSWLAYAEKAHNEAKTPEERHKFYWTSFGLSIGVSHNDNIKDYAYDIKCNNNYYGLANPLRLSDHQFLVQYNY